MDQEIEDLRFDRNRAPRRNSRRSVSRAQSWNKVAQDSHSASGRQLEPRSTSDGITPAFQRKKHVDRSKAKAPGKRKLEHSGILTGIKES